MCLITVDCTWTCWSHDTVPGGTVAPELCPCPHPWNLFVGAVRDKVKELRMRSWVGALNPITSVLTDRRGHRGQGRVATEAEIAVTQPQAKGRLEPPEAGQDRKDPRLEPAEGANLLTP